MLDLASFDVLVVEDEPDLNFMLGAYVRLAGFSCRSALDGAAALVALRERTPGLVLLDLMLPDIDGFEVCRRLRDDPATRDVPVVMLTARDDLDARRRAGSLGVREYLTKPFDPEALIAVIQRNVGG